MFPVKRYFAFFHFTLPSIVGNFFFQRAANKQHFPFCKENAGKKLIKRGLGNKDDNEENFKGKPKVRVIELR